MIEMQFRVTSLGNPQDLSDPVIGFFSVRSERGEFGYIHFDELVADEFALTPIETWAHGLAKTTLALRSGHGFYLRDPDRFTHGVVFQLCRDEVAVIESRWPTDATTTDGRMSQSGTLGDGMPWRAEFVLWTGPLEALEDQLLTTLRLIVEEGWLKPGSPESTSVVAALGREGEG